MWTEIKLPVGESLIVRVKNIDYFVINKAEEVEVSVKGQIFNTLLDKKQMDAIVDLAKGEENNG